MANNTRSSLAGALKVLYDKRGLEKVVYVDHVGLGLFPKMEQFGGKTFDVPIYWGNGTGGSTSASVAVSNQGAMKVSAFALTPTTEYSSVAIDGLALASLGSEQSFLNQVSAVVDAGLNTVGSALGIGLYRTGFGGLCQVTAVTSAPTYSVSAGEIHLIEPGMSVVFSGGSTETASIRAGGAMTVTAVNRAASTFTLSGSPTSGAIGDWVIREGDADDGAGAAARKASGILAWCPASASAPGALFGVTRSADSRLYGVYSDQSAITSSVEEAVVNGSFLAEEMGGAPDVFFMNPRKFVKLIQELGSKVQFSKDPARLAGGKSLASVAFRGVQIESPTGPITVYSDRYCPLSYGFALNMSDWNFYSMGKLIQFLGDPDGNKWNSQMIKASPADGFEIGIKSYSQIGCRAPGRQATVKLPS